MSFSGMEKIAVWNSQLTQDVVSSVMTAEGLAPCVPRSSVVMALIFFKFDECLNWW